MAERTFTYKEWNAEVVRRFGANPMKWRFVCPSCNHIASVEDYKKAGAPEGAIAFSCLGRFTGSKKTIGDRTGGPCNYSGSGLLHLNPIRVEMDDGSVFHAFDFAEAV